MNNLPSLASFIRHAVSGDVYAVRYQSEDSDVITSIVGPLHYTEYRHDDGTLKDPADFGIDTENATWANSQPWTWVL
jgi:hypothetical protein